MNSPSRSCGDCDVCCGGTLKGKSKGHYFYPGKPCFFISPIGGCSIYDERPRLCQDYECGWLIDNSIPEELWPKNSHVIINIYIDGVKVIPEYGYDISDEIKEKIQKWADSKNLKVSSISSDGVVVEW